MTWQTEGNDYYIIDMEGRKAYSGLTKAKAIATLEDIASDDEHSDLSDVRVIKGKVIPFDIEGGLAYKATIHG